VFQSLLNCSELQALELSRSWALSDLDIFDFLRHFPSLRQFKGSVILHYYQCKTNKQKHQKKERKKIKN